MENHNETSIYSISANSNNTSQSKDVQNNISLLKIIINVICCCIEIEIERILRAAALGNIERYISQNRLHR